MALGCSGPGIPEERFCADHAEIECRSLTGWCGIEPGFCQAARTAACQMRQQANRGGSRLYDKTAALTCIDKLVRAYQAQPIPIATLRDLQATCDRVYHGNGEVDQGCRADLDCRKGLICRGRCVADVQVDPGASCDQLGTRCPGTHYCAITSGGPGGNRRTCIPAIAQGQSCAAGSCQDHLRCQDMICASRQPLEAECDRDLDCAPPAAYCNPYTGLCADRLGFTPGSVSCQVQAGLSVTSDASAPDRRVLPPVADASDVDVGGDAED